MTAPKDPDDTTLPPGANSTESSPQKDILFAIIAHQHRFVKREAIIPALADWKQNSEKALSSILIERKIITEEQKAHILRLVQERLGKHSNDFQACLTALSAEEASASELRSFAESDISATLPHFGPVDDLEATTDPANGSTETVDFDSSNSTAKVSSPVVSSTPKHRYRVIHTFAKGGLGEVFIAEDQELKRKVALKEIQKQHSDHSESRRRFVLEAEVTGRLEHPGIVPVYGLGHYDDGRPYYAMRFIHGDSFQKEVKLLHKKYPAKNHTFFYSRPLQSLLRRFMDVCNAIHYAHEQNVLHRDIKPANVMLGKYGETLVVDWGLAKILRPENARSKAGVTTGGQKYLSGSNDATHMGSVIGTPAYMSPEQATGASNLTRATDIYSLGAMLFTILTGEVPIQGTTLHDTLNRVRTGQVRLLKETVPSAPSALSSICRRAMELEPKKRYATARELADDLELWMADEPVMAHRDAETFVERAGRLMRRYRNWTLSIGAATLLIALVAIAASFLINHARLQEQVAKQQAGEYRNEALSRYRQSREAVDGFLVDANESLAYFPATLGIRQRMLEMAERHYQDLSSELNSDPELEFERGRALVRLGDVLQMQGRFNEARERYQNAIKTFEQDAARKHPIDPQGAKRLTVEAAYARSRLGLAWDFEDQIDAATEAYDQTIKVLREELQSKDFPEKTPRYLALALANRANLFEHLGQPAEAVASLQECLSLYENYPNAGLKQTDLHREKTRSLLALAFQRVNKNDEASELISTAQSNLSKLFEANANRPEYGEALATARSYQAEIDGALGRATEQHRAIGKALEEYKQLSTTFPNEPRYLEKVAGALTSYGIVQYELGYADDANASFESATELYADLVNSYGLLPSYQEGYAAASDGRGQVLLDTQANAKDALIFFDQALPIYEQLTQQSPQVPVYRERLAVLLSHQARALARSDQHELAHSKFDESIQMLKQLAVEQPQSLVYLSDQAYVHQWHGLLYRQSEPERAREQFESAIKLWRDLVSRSTSSVYAYQLALILSECPIESLRDETQATEFAKRAQQASPTNGAYTILLAKNLAKEDAKRSLELLKELDNRVLEQTARYHLARAVALRATGDTAGADAAMKAAQAWFEKHQPYNENLALALE